MTVAPGAPPAVDPHEPAPHEPDPLEPWPDTVAWRPVSPKLVTVKQIHVLAWAVVLGLLLVPAWLFLDTWFAAVASAALVVLTVTRAVVVVRSVRSWGYAEREDDLLVRHGVLVRRLSIVPYARMQFVDVTAGPLERSFGLATVKLHTAAAASDAEVPGLDGAEATRLRDRLSALGEARHEGL